MSLAVNIACRPSDRLLHAATQLFWERSYAGVSVEEICDRAAVKKGSFHYFFSSKPTLLRVALKMERRHDCGILDQIFAAHFSPLSRFKSLCEEGYEIQRRKRAECGRVCGWFTGTLGSEIAFRDEAARVEAVKTIDEIIDRLEDGITRPMFDSQAYHSKPRELASRLFCHLQGCLMEARIRDDLQPLRGMADGVRIFSLALSSGVSRSGT